MAGHCFHLYTKFRYDHHFRKDPLPEILRVPLEQAILRIKVLPLFENREVSKVMSNLLEPPAWEAVANAVSRCGTVASSNFYKCVTNTRNQGLDQWLLTVSGDLQALRATPNTVSWYIFVVLVARYEEKLRSFEGAAQKALQRSKTEGR